MPSSSRKLPCSLTRDGRASARSEHLIPDPALRDPVFVGIRSGKRHDAGYVCYVGKDVTATDVVAALGSPLSRKAAAMLDDFLMQLASFRIDNVIAVSWVEGRLQLIKVADHTVRERKSPLP